MTTDAWPAQTEWPEGLTRDGDLWLWEGNLLCPETNDYLDRLSTARRNGSPMGRMRMLFDGSIHYGNARGYAPISEEAADAIWEVFVENVPVRPNPKPKVTQPKLTWVPEVPSANGKGGAVLQPNLRKVAEPTPEPLEILRLDDEFWNADLHSHDMLAPGLLPQGRYISIVSEGKAGKSLLMLDIATSLAMGGPVLGRPNPPGRRVRVLYLDAEMTEADFRDRLVALGYGSTDDLDSHLFYSRLTNRAGHLDTKTGAAQLLATVEALDPELVVVDTIARLTEGEENAKETWDGVLLLAANPLRNRGCTLVTVDHLGKDKSKGARGSSAKGQTVDVSWHLTATPGTGGHPDRLHLRIPDPGSRLGWLSRDLTIERTQGPDGLEHRLQVGQGGTAVVTASQEARDLAAKMDDLGMPTGIGRRKAGPLLRDEGETFTNAVLEEALRWRKRHPGEAPGTFPGTSLGEEASGHISGTSRAHAEEARPDGLGTSPGTSGHIDADTPSGHIPPPKGGRVPGVSTSERDFQTDENGVVLFGDTEEDE